MLFNPKRTLFLVAIFVLLSAPVCVTKFDRVFAADNERVYKINSADGYKQAIEIVAFNNLQSPEFPKDFTIEVKNISNKPIYHILVDVTLPETKYTSPGTMGITYIYGRHALVNLKELATAEDKPILPGESVILQRGRGEGDLRKWLGANGHDVERALSRLSIHFTSINFGDGTGFLAGSPYPARRK